jgi:hypothetical protein
MKRPRRIPSGQKAQPLSQRKRRAGLAEQIQGQAHPWRPNDAHVFWRLANTLGPAWTEITHARRVPSLNRDRLSNQLAL